MLRAWDELGRLVTSSGRASGDVVSPRQRGACRNQAADDVSDSTVQDTCRQTYKEEGEDDAVERISKLGSGEG